MPKSNSYYRYYCYFKSQGWGFFKAQNSSDLDQSGLAIEEDKEKHNYIDLADGVHYYLGADELGQKVAETTSDTSEVSGSVMPKLISEKMQEGKSCAAPNRKGGGYLIADPLVRDKKGGIVELSGLIGLIAGIKTVVVNNPPDSKFTIGGADWKDMAKILLKLGVKQENINIVNIFDTEKIPRISEYFYSEDIDINDAFEEIKQAEDALRQRESTQLYSAPKPSSSEFTATLRAAKVGPSLSSSSMPPVVSPSTKGPK